MSLIEMLESVQYVVDSQGQKTAVQFDLAAWDTLRPLFEEVMEDAHLALRMDETIDDERFEGEAALQAYQAILSQV